MRSILLCTLMIIATGVAVLRAQDSASVPAADGFQCPVGPNGTAEGYYIARSFRSNGHLGDDWNGVKGGDTDYGDPVYAIGHGVVVFAKNYHVGWGNVVIIRHAYHEGFALRYVDSLYGHLADFTVREGQIVRRGQQIGRIGSNNGMYDAHLHFEIRKNINIGMYRSSFPRDGTNYYVPNQFIAAHLTCSGGNKTVSVPINTFPAAAPPSYAAAKVYTPVYSPGSAPASHRAPVGAGTLPLRGLRTTEPPPAPRIVTSPPPTPTPKPVAPPAPVVETPTTASTSKTKKDALAPVASKGSPIASSDKKDSEKKDSKKEPSPPASSKTSKTASNKTSDEPPPKELRESGSKEAEKKESVTASTKKSATPTPSAKSTAASTKTGSSSSTKAAAASTKPTPAPSKPSTTASSKPSPTPAREPATAKTAAAEPAPQPTAKPDPKPSILDAVTPLPPTATEGSPIRRSAPGFRVDRFQDLRGMGY
jgi:hypothetical protein